MRSAVVYRFQAARRSLISGAEHRPPAGVRALADKTGASADCEGGGEPRLGTTFRIRSGPDVVGLWQEVATSRASGAARLARRGVHGTRLELSSSPPGHLPQRRLSAVERPW